MAELDRRDVLNAVVEEHFVVRTAAVQVKALGIRGVDADFVMGKGK